MPLRLRTLVLSTLASLPLLVSAAQAKQPYTVTPGPNRDDAAFTVTYKGEGTYRTVFHGEPHNPDGHKDDVNDAHDTSRQSWTIKYGHSVAFPTCGQPADGGADPCASVAGLDGASGTTLMTGRVNHRHVDGIYRQLDRTVKCKLRKSPKRRGLQATLGVRYIPESQSFGVRAYNPIFTAASLFPTQCPKQGDSIDRIADFYAMPGFSFAQDFGPDRWFTSREVVIPAADLHRAAKIAIPLEDTPAGTPPRRCAVRDPSFERCKTGGSWSGVLTLKAKPATAAGATASAAASKVKAPKSGHYHGNAGPAKRPFDLYTAGKSIQIVAFAFTCRNVTGRTSLNDITLKKAKNGYKFAIRAHGSIGFSDDQPDENGAVDISGRFSRSTAKTVRGKLRVKSKRCGDTGSLDWHARLAPK